MTERTSWADCRDATERHLADSSSVAALLLGADLRIERANDAFLRMADLGGGAVGVVLDHLLAPPSRGPAAQLLSGEIPVERLQFVGSSGVVFLLSCRVYSEGERKVLIGEALKLTDHEIFRTMTRLNSEVVNLSRDLSRKNRELQHALDEIKVLRGILPICMYCKRIRHDQGSWQQLEQYITEHSEAEFTHGLCGECEAKHFPPDDAGGEPSP